MKRYLPLVIAAFLTVWVYLSQAALAQEAAAVPAYREGIQYASEGRFKDAQDWFKANLGKNRVDVTSASSIAVIKDLNDGKITEKYAISFFKGLDLLQNAKIQEGVKELEGAIELNPAYPRPYNVLGIVYASLGDTGKAVGYFQKAIEINPGYKEACYNLAALYQSMQQPQDAIKFYKKAMELDQDDLDTLNNLAGLYASLGEYDQAIAYYSQAIKLHPDNANLRYGAALAYFMSGDFAKFKDNLLRARALYSEIKDVDGLKKVDEYISKMKALEEKAKHAK